MKATRTFFADTRAPILRRLLAALLVLAALALGFAAIATLMALEACASPAPATAATRYTLRGEKVAIYNLAGRMRIEPGEGGDVVIEVAPAGQDAGRLKIETGPIGGRSTLRVIYPDRRVVYPELRFGSGTEVRVRDDGTFGDKNKWNAGDLLPYALGGSKRSVTVSGSGEGLEAHADLRVLVPRGQHLELHLGAGPTSVTRVEGEIFVDVYASPVSVDGVRGSLSVDTGSGGVHVASVHGSRISLDTGSGEVEASDLASETLIVDTGSGEVSLTGVSAPDVKVDTGSGAVRLDLLSDIRSLRVDTGSGGVTLGIPRSLGAEIEVDTGSGGIDSDAPVQLIRRDSDYLKGRIGDGRGKISIDTGSGGVRLRGV